MTKWPYSVHDFSMKQTDPHFKIRLPPDLKERLAQEAKANGRSLNAEIVFLLEMAKASEEDRMRQITEAIDRLNQRMDKLDGIAPKKPAP